MHGASVARRKPAQPQHPQDPHEAVDFLHDSHAETQQASPKEDVVEVLHGDPAVARFAAATRGAIARAGLTDAGLGRGAIAHRIDRGRLHRVHRGVYLVGHAIPPEFAAHHAAVLAHGPNAYISHATALEDYAVIEPVGGPIHVTVLNACRRSRPGIRVHRTTRIEPQDLGLLDDHLPITSPARAILDYAETASLTELSRAISEAEVLELATPDEIRALIARTPGRRGTRKVIYTLGRHAGPVVLHEGVERMAYAIIDKTPIRNPETNASIVGVKVDLLWREEKLVVELDSGRYHGVPAAVDRDRRKEAHLRKNDCELLRYSYWQIKEEPHFFVAEVAAKLEQLRAQTRP